MGVVSYYRANPLSFVSSKGMDFQKFANDGGDDQTKFYNLLQER